MKKNLFLLVALASVAIGCTKSEVVKAPGHNKEIKFNTYVGKTAATKAVSGDLAYLQSFTSEETPSFHVNAFLHDESAVKIDESTGLLDISKIGMTSAYMDKDVWWLSGTDATGIPEETPTLKVIFSEAAVTPAPTLEGAYDGSSIPTGWYDSYSPLANWYATSEQTANTEDGTPTWSAWTIIAITEDNNTNANGSWDYPGTVYWPDATTNRKLAFSAYSLNASDNITFSIPGEGENAERVETPYSHFTYTVPESVAEQDDLLVTPLIPSQGISATGEHATVGLSFKHLLSRVGFSLIANRNEPDIKISIKSVVLEGPFASQGIVALKSLAPEITPIPGAEQASYSLFESMEGGQYEYFEWESSKDRHPIYANKIYTPEVVSKDETTQEEVKTPEEFKDKEDAAPENRYMMIIPTTLGADACISVVYQLTDGAEQTAEISLANWKFEAGKSYDFVFKVSTSAIGFYVEVTDWLPYFPNGENTGIYPLNPEVPEE